MAFGVGSGLAADSARAVPAASFSFSRGEASACLFSSVVSGCGGRSASSRGCGLAGFKSGYSASTSAGTGLPSERACLTVPRCSILVFFGSSYVDERTRTIPSTSCSASSRARLSDLRSEGGMRRLRSLLIAAIFSRRFFRLAMWRSDMSFFQPSRVISHGCFSLASAPCSTPFSSAPSGRAGSATGGWALV